MKVYSLSLLALNAATPATSTVLSQVNDLSSFSFYQRGSVGEFMGFFTKVSLWFSERWGVETGSSSEEGIVR
jgi:synaptobrevin family protein YKT6